MTRRYCEFTGDKDTPWDGVKNRVCSHAGFRWCLRYLEPLGESEDGWRTCCESCEHPFQIKRHSNRGIKLLVEVAELKQRITELEGALEDIAAYATIETPAEVTEIINGVLNKEDN